MCGEISDSPTAAARMPAHQLVDRGVLQQVAARAGEDRVHHVGVLVGDRQHEHARERRIAAIWRVASTPFMPGMFRSMTTTSGASSRTSGARPAPLAASPTICDALLLEQGPQAGPEEVVVVDEQHAYARARSCAAAVLDDFGHADLPERVGQARSLVTLQA